MRIFNLYHKPPVRLGYDCMYDITVRAKNEKRARELASENAGGEGRECWLDSTKTYCDVVSAQGPEAVITRDFLNG